MSNITNVHIVKEDNGKFDATVERSDGQVANQAFDTFEEANAWVQDQEYVTPTTAPENEIANPENPYGQGIVEAADLNQQRLDDVGDGDQVAEETAASDELNTQNETAKAEAEQGDDPESN